MEDSADSWLCREINTRGLQININHIWRLPMKKIKLLTVAIMLVLSILVTLVLSDLRTVQKYA